METIAVTYEIGARDVKRAARLVAREQSLGVKITPYETQEIKQLEAKVSSLRGQRTKGLVRIEVASESIESAYGLFLSIAGEVSCLGGMNYLRLADFELPDRIARLFGGPRWGRDGLRNLLGIRGRPIFICVVKPSQGLTPKEYGTIAYDCLVGGIDIVKTDELLQESQEDFMARVRAGVEAARRAEAETGEKKMFMAHVVAHAGEITRLYEEAVSAGSGIAMLAPAAAGFPFFQAIAMRSRVPIMAHMSTSGWLWGRHGMSVTAWSKFLRLFGADIVLYTALEGTLRCSPSEIKEVKKACEMPLRGLKASLPAAGGGQHAGTLAIHRKYYGHDFAFLCGGGVCGHPDGARAGARSIRQAWEALEQGIPLKTHAKRAPELAQALTAFKKYV